MGWSRKFGCILVDNFMVVPSIIPLSQNIGIEIQRAMNKHIFSSITYSLFAILNIIITF